VAEVDETTVVVQVWAATTDELEEWLPLAQGFVDSIHFEEQR
jgi:hypothetical protein